MPASTSVADRIRAKLTEALSPEHLEVEDQSERHRGHGGWREGGETHFHIVVRAAAFDGVSRVQRQRMVNRILSDELADRVHALSMSLSGARE